MAEELSNDKKKSLVDVQDIRRVWGLICNEIKKVLVGKLEEIEILWSAMLVGKHVYFEGVPGIAKTWMCNSFAKTMGCEFKRIQFTPDMLPSDIIGTNVFNPKTGTFYLRKGPIFTNICLADEINRAPPKTQSALLEAMQEGQVTIEGETLKLPQPFIVIATANPVEQEGTYPLPEAQLDRFLVKIRVDYPSPDEELDVIRLKNNPVAQELKVVTSPEAIGMMQETVKHVYISEDLMDYIRRIVVSTRQDPRLILGGSPRASIALLESCKARAAIHGRNYVVPDDIKTMLVHTVHHRLILRPEAQLEGIDQIRISEDISREAAVPVDLPLGES
ncbi:MAG: AAA family ATPase [Candidatus Hermodarchaeota archaeon]